MGMYNAEISAGSLMLPESRRIAKLRMGNPSEVDWTEALRGENVLQKKTPATARRQARLIAVVLRAFLQMSGAFACKRLGQPTWQAFIDDLEVIAPSR